MNIKSEISDSEIQRYLLGALDQPRVESIDELTVTDADFSGRVSSIERDLIDEYVRGELDAESRELVEDHYLQTPRRRERLRVAESLDGYFSQRRTNQIAESRGGDGGKKPFGFFWKLAIPAFGLAILLAAAIPFFYRSGTETAAVGDVASSPGPEPRSAGTDIQSGDTQADVRTDTDPPPSPLPTGEPDRETETKAAPKPRVFALTLTPQTRGIAGEKRIALPAATDTLRVSLQLEPNDYATYLIDLRNRTTGAVVWQRRVRTSRSADAFQSIRFNVPARSIGPGTYSFTAYGTDRGREPEILGDYPFTVVQ